MVPPRVSTPLCAPESLTSRPPDPEITPEKVVPPFWVRIRV